MNIQCYRDWDDGIIEYPKYRKGFKNPIKRIFKYQVRMYNSIILSIRCFVQFCSFSYRALHAFGEFGRNTIGAWSPFTVFK